MIQHFIGGRFVASRSGESFQTLDPATNHPLAEIAAGGPADVDLAVRSAREAFDDGPWPRMPVAERARRLRRVAELIEQRADEIAAIEIADTGVPVSQLAKGVIARAAENFDFFATMALQLQSDAYPVDGIWLNYTLRRPVGVAGLITPWNVPFMLETWKVAPCLAAGNTCILKPAEWAPLSADRLAAVIAEADLPPGVLNVVHGIGETAGAALVAHPGVQLISFTGETATGQEIMRNGAATLKRFSMELGGKSPAIVFADANLDRALDGAIFQIFSLNGERCTAGSRLLVAQAIHDEFLAALADRAQHIRVGDPRDPRTEIGPLIHPDHWARVRGHVEVARQEGAYVLVGGDRPPALPAGNYLAPTVIGGVRGRMRIAQEEVFGPVLAVIPFADEAEAIRIANDVPYGLAGYVWTSDLARGHRVAQALDCGLVWLNSHNVRDLRTPFGGTKASGIGREGGRHSFDFYTELKTVHVPLEEHAIPRLGALED